MPKPGESNFAPSALDNLTDEEIRELLKGTGYRVPPPRPKPEVNVYRANFKDGQ